MTSSISFIPTDGPPSIPFSNSYIWHPFYFCHGHFISQFSDHHSPSPHRPFSNTPYDPFHVTITSCKKDNSLKPEQGDSASNVVPAGSITLRDGSAPAVVNGILTFASYGDAKKFAASLQEDETDQTKINAAYAQLGIDVNGQAIPNLTDNPVCLVAEQSLGFTSARKIEENAINALLNQGDDNVFSIVHDPYWKTLLNADHAVRMGNRIYRYFEDGGIAIVLKQ
jgi:hypothetical protein